jgi:hypothetical protein
MKLHILPVLTILGTVNGFQLDLDCLGSLVQAKDIIGNCTSSATECCDISTRQNIKFLVNNIKTGCDQVNQTVVTGLEVGTFVLDLACSKLTSSGHTYTPSSSGHVYTPALLFLALLVQF